MKFISKPAFKRTLHQDIPLIGLLCKWYKSRHPRRFSFKGIYSRRNWFIWWSMPVKSSTVMYHFKYRSQCLVTVAKELWTWLDQVVSEWYFRKKYHNSDGSRFHLVALLPLVLNKNGNTEYHGIFISFKSQLYSEQGSFILLIRLMV